MLICRISAQFRFDRSSASAILHSAVPDNLIRIILHGIASRVSSDLGYMPGFKESMTDDQVAELVSYLRRQFAPDKSPWTGVAVAVSYARQAAPD